MLWYVCHKTSMLGQPPTESFQLLDNSAMKSGSRKAHVQEPAKFPTESAADLRKSCKMVGVIIFERTVLRSMDQSPHVFLYQKNKESV